MAPSCPNIGYYIVLLSNLLLSSFGRHPSSVYAHLRMIVHMIGLVLQIKLIILIITHTISKCTSLID